MHHPQISSLAIAILLAAATTGIGAENDPAKPVFDPSGTVHVPAFELPPSTLLSNEALQAQKMRAGRPVGAPSSSGDIAAARKGLERMLAPQVAGMRKLYSVDVVDQTIGPHFHAPHGFKQFGDRHNRCR